MKTVAQRTLFRRTLLGWAASLLLLLMLAILSTTLTVGAAAEGATLGSSSMMRETKETEEREISVDAINGKLIVAFSTLPDQNLSTFPIHDFSATYSVNGRRPKPLAIQKADGVNVGTGKVRFLVEELPEEGFRQSITVTLHYHEMSFEASRPFTLEGGGAEDLHSEVYFTAFVIDEKHTAGTFSLNRLPTNLTAQDFSLEIIPPNQSARPLTLSSWEMQGGTTKGEFRYEPVLGQSEAEKDRTYRISYANTETMEFVVKGNGSVLPPTDPPVEPPVFPPIDPPVTPPTDTSKKNPTQSTEGTSRADLSPLVSIQLKRVTMDEVKAAVKEALLLHRQNPSALLTAKFKDKSYFSREVLQYVLQQVKGVPATLQVRQREAGSRGAFSVQVTWPVSRQSGMVALGGWIYSTTAKRVQQHFEKFFSNSVTVLHLEQEDFGVNTAVTFAIHEAMLHSENIVLYHYDIKQNTYREVSRFKGAGGGGFLSFITQEGGCFVASDGELLLTQP